MADYLFLLGKHPELSYLELSSVLLRMGLSGVLENASPQFATDTHLISASGLDDDQVTKIQEACGGLVKSARLLHTKANSIEQTIVEDLLSSEASRFALHGVSGTHSITNLSKNIKRAIQSEGKRSAYSEPKNIYNSALFPKTTEYFLGKKWIAKVVTAQDINHWSKKDYGRPAVDPRSGMMPPKVARMLTNISIHDRDPQATTFFDPFCGSGTLMIEAADLGSKDLVASDISDRAIRDTQKNLAWYKKTFEKSFDQKVFVSDVHRLNLQMLDNKLIDAIAFEGYLGSPNIKPDKIPNVVKGLTKLYIGAFKKLYPLLKPGGRVVAALPAFVDSKGNVKNLKGLIDRCENIGYTSFRQPLYYYRNKQEYGDKYFFLQKRIKHYV